MLRCKNVSSNLDFFYFYNFHNDRDLNYEYILIITFTLKLEYIVPSGPSRAQTQ